MKRYSIAIAYNRCRAKNKVKFHYYGRTDNIEETKEWYFGMLKRWIDNITNEDYEYRNILNDYCGIKITDSTTKEIVFEDCHLSEEYGYKKACEAYTCNGRTFYKVGEWQKI